MVPAPEAAEAAPLWAQISAGAVGFLSLCGMIWNGVRSVTKPEEKAEPASHLVMEAASLADVRPFTERLDKILLEVIKATLAAEKSALTASEMLLCIREWIRDDRERREEEQRDALQELRIRQRMDDALRALGGPHEKT